MYVGVCVRVCNICCGVFFNIIITTSLFQNRPKSRRTSLKQQKPAKPSPSSAASAATPTTANVEKPPPRKRGRPRKEQQDMYVTSNIQIFL